MSPLRLLVPGFIAILSSCGTTSPQPGSASAPVADDALAMSVRQVMPMSGGVAVVGRVMHGVARAPSRAELLGFGDPRPVQIGALSVDRNLVTEVVAGQDAAAFLVGLGVDAVRVGQVLATPGAYRATRTYVAEFMLTKDLDNPERNVPATAPYPVTVGGVKGEFRGAKPGAPLSYEVPTRGTVVLDEAIVLLPFTSTITWGGSIVGDLTIIAPGP